jgi:capsular polysaccharide biosynthesis protein
VADAATLGASPDVLDEAAAQLSDGRDGVALATDVTVVPQSNSHSVTIVATGKTAPAARAASEAVAAAMTDILERRISGTADSLADVAGGDFRATLEQRAQVLTTSVQPLQVLQTAPAQQTGPSFKTPVMLAVVGLAAGMLLVIALVFTRPVVTSAREAQRLTQLPAVPLDGGHDRSAAIRLIRRLLDSRPKGQIFVVPVDAEAEKAAQQFADWAREHTASSADAARIVATGEPVDVVIDRRPRVDAVAAVVLIAPRGVSRSALTDSVALLSTWRSADAVVISA